MRDLPIREDGSLTIVQFTDVHWKNGEPEDLRSEALMERVLEWEKPDLVVFTGDVIEGGHCRNRAHSYRSAVRAVEERGIAWAAVFGNHDTEFGGSKEELLQVMQESKHSLVERGPELGDRMGNYVVRIRDPKTLQPLAALYFIDSGGTADEPPGGYAWVTHDQIKWYRKQSARLAAENGGTPLPALAFLHIPLPEYDEVWNRGACRGHKYEPVCSPKINSGLFASFVEMGDVRGVFAGHDHVNDYWGELHGIRLHYGRATGFNTYGKENFQRGARVIRLDEKATTFRSWIRLEDGTVEQEPPADSIREAL
jgi:3',5'-cyclic AMP phosphodiesterase CpdA